MMRRKRLSAKEYYERVKKRKAEAKARKMRKQRRWLKEGEYA